jgi:hypothetical protein
VRDVAKRGNDGLMKMNSDVRNVRHLVEDVDISNSWMRGLRREEELIDRPDSANGLVANTRPSSEGSQPDGFGRDTL